ncbi:MAG: hypothetical protein AMXMBFR13_14920 [Phycisphaerae bacterium]
MNAQNTLMILPLLALPFTVLGQDSTDQAAGEHNPDMCLTHQIEEARCPFCNPDLIQKLGFCSGHGVPEAVCTRCNAALIPAFKAERDWCEEHGLPESQCAKCDPAAAEKWVSIQPKSSSTEDSAAVRLWCKEHGVYEDECTICHPELKDRPTERGASPLMCKEHNVPEAECGICHPELAENLGAGGNLKIRLPSRHSAEKAGIKLGKPEPTTSNPGLSVFCEVRYNQNRLARITPLASGVVHRVLADVGQDVSEGDVLVEIASSEVAGAKRDYLIALVDENVKSLALERERQLLAKKISAEQNYQRAEAEYEMAQIVTATAQQRLLNYGFDAEDIKEIKKTRSSSSILKVRAPYAGSLVSRSAVVGEAVEPGAPLFTLVDLSTMWLELAVPESQADHVHAGLSVEAAIKDVVGGTAKGELVWVDASVDERNRLVKARAVVQNPDRKFRNNMFGNVRILWGTSAKAFRVPSEALQTVHGAPHLFVRLDTDLYALRRVVVGERNGRSSEIMAGLLGNEPIVVAGSHTMKSEFFKSRLGAGCVDD